MSASAELIAVNAKYVTLIAAIDDSTIQTEADWRRAQWLSAETALEAYRERGMLSYSTNGRNFSFPSVQEAENQSQVAKGRLDGLLGFGGGNVAYVDLSGGRR